MHSETLSRPETIYVTSIVLLLLAAVVAVPQFWGKSVTGSHEDHSRACLCRDACVRGVSTRTAGHEPTAVPREPSWVSFMSPAGSFCSQHQSRQATLLPRVTESPGLWDEGPCQS